MKKVVTLILVLPLQVSFAQNLVNNGSFEDTVQCPPASGNIYQAVGWSSYANTPDYFNSCNTGPVGVPLNVVGFQYAENGNAYAGFGAFFSTPQNFREVIGTQLSQPLTIGQPYYLSFYVAPAYNPVQGIGMAVNKIGIRLATVAYAAVNPVQIDNYSQIYSDSIVTDTLNWTKIKGSFVADSAYSYIAFGNFFTDALCSTVLLYPTALESYYYIDDIKFSSDSNYVNTVKLYGKDTSINIFPNPAWNGIEIKGNDIQSLILYDVLGRIVYFNSEFVSPLKIDISFFSRGMYLLLVRQKNNIVQGQKIMKY